MSEFAGLRVLLVQEWLYTWAGAERCLDELVGLIPHADVIAGTVTPAIRDRQLVARQARETWLGRIPGARARHQWFLPLHAVAFASIDTSRYDLVISLSHSFGKLTRRPRGGRHLCYCFSPPRYLWDLSETYDRTSPALQRTALRLLRKPLRAIDRHGARGVDHFVGISACVADRIRRSYGRESTVVYPPVTPKGAPGLGTRAPFLLSLGRLVPYKRVDLAILAAGQLGMELVVAGDGVDRARLQRLAGPRVRFLGQVSESEAGQLLDQCAAFLFCGEEDFGIAPLEANAHGAPVVFFARGGAAETMIAGETGVAFHEPSPDAVARAITDCVSRDWDRGALQRNASRFSPARFRDGMAAEVRRVMAARVGGAPGGRRS